MRWKACPNVDTVTLQQMLSGKKTCATGASFRLDFV
jgi:hypothetical protein